jgi:isopenicillin N synthase-like dioxygenase
MHYMQAFTTTIHSALSDALGVNTKERLELFHREQHPSPCILRLLKYHEQPLAERGAVQTPHTDLGSLTILFTSQPGLQVLPKGSTDAWEFVAPRERCAIVNIGDALAMITGGMLHSSLHRVGPLPNRRMETRYSFAYLQRPEAHTILKTGSEELSSGEWLKRKFGMLRKDTYTHDQQWILTSRHQDVIAARD